MLRRTFIGGAASAALSAFQARPNVLFLLADQWRPQTLPAAGDPDLVAPNLKRLAGSGVHFRRAYASNPVCTPSRASVITGRFPHACRMPRNNLRLQVDEPSIATQFKADGYSTGYIGKWHLDGEERPGFVPPGPRRRGFDYWAAFNRGHQYYDSVYFRDEPEPLRGEGFEPEYQTSLAIDFLRRNKANPFFLYLSWGPPHTPRRPPPKFALVYDPRQFRLRENVPPEWQEKARTELAGYYGLCSALDYQLGRLLIALEEEGLAENTLVVFTADHGDMLGSHGLDFKGVHYEESAGIPLLIRFPGRMQPGGKSDVLLSNVDLMPTLLSLCGAEALDGVQGRDLSSLLLGGDEERPESVFCYGKLETPDEWRMVVRGVDKLVTDASSTPTHLYNLAQDPYEQNNLVADPRHRRRRDEMQAHMREWVRRIGYGMHPSGLKLREGRP
jgi:arylsulfatase A-like enzyme